MATQNQVVQRFFAIHDLENQVERARVHFNVLNARAVGSGALSDFDAAGEAFAALLLAKKNLATVQNEVEWPKSFTSTVYYEDGSATVRGSDPCLLGLTAQH